MKIRKLSNKFMDAFKNNGALQAGIKFKDKIPLS